MIARQVTIRGIVQGVGFRWHTRIQALQLGVNGWIRNMPDGSVEAHIQGDSGAVEALLDWLSSGPPAARVIGVQQAQTGLIIAESFQVAD